MVDITAQETSPADQLQLVAAETCSAIINANHIRSVKDGVVTGTVRPLHIGRKTHVWETRIHDAEDRLVAVSRLTVAVLDLEQ